MSAADYDLAALDAAIKQLFPGGKLHYAPVTASTNTDALEAARAGAAHGSVFLADQQTAGRGRGDHAWQSPAGVGLYVSLLLRPRIPATRLALLPLAAGLAAVEAVRSATGLHIDLRWPNDLLIGPRKLGGILVESQLEAAAVAHAVVGIGINVLQHSFDPTLATPATSLALELAQTGQVSRQTLLIALLQALAREAALLADPEAAAQIPARAHAASTWLSNRAVAVHGPQACTGITRGLDANGFLRVETAAGIATIQTGGLRDAEPAHTQPAPGQPTPGH